MGHLLDAVGQVTINRTTGGDLFWGQPLALPAEGSHVTVDDIATIVAYGPGKVGVLWGNRADGAYYFSSHEDGDPDDAWSTARRRSPARPWPTTS